MSERAERFFARRKIAIPDIKYLYHSGRYTLICMTDGQEIKTFLPLKEIAVLLPESGFWSIQKGILLAVRYIIGIDDGVYTMIDGRQFTGRKHNPAEHKRRLRELEKLALVKEKSTFPQTLMEKCTLMENAPIAFCVIELVFEDNGRGIDFIFRYCNKEMETVEGVPVSEMIDRSFYAVFPNGDKKWIIPYADVALNGSRKTLRDFSPEINKNLIIQCFQPQEGFCACFLLVDEEYTPNPNQTL